MLTPPCAFILKSFNLQQKQMNFLNELKLTECQGDRKKNLHLKNLKVGSFSAAGHRTLFRELKRIRCCVLYSVTVLYKVLCPAAENDPKNH